jgi:phosphatidylethanolamine-binding protein (PEBP) family uncharacterized protein
VPKKSHEMNLHARKQSQVAVAGLSLLLAIAGCSSASSGGGTGGSHGEGSGGSGNGSGGASSGGSPGSGGASTGGSPGSGGASSGGSPGSGGASSGGSPGSGGASTGGSPGHGGAASGGSGQEGGRSGGAGRTGSGGGGTSTGGGGGGSGSGFTLTSPDHTDNAKFDSKFTCAESPPRSGQMVGKLNNGINPELDWAGAPSGTMSFAITFLDTTLIDANMASFGNHWALWNIPASVMQLPQGTTMLSGALMAAKQTGVFLAPCAQSVMNNMDDQYEFTIYALPTATLTVSGSGVMNVRDALKTASPLATAVLRGHSGQYGK